MVMKVEGWLLMIESLFMTVPLITSLIYREDDYKAFLCAIAITLCSGILLTFGLHPRRTDMGKREGFLLTGLVWVLYSFFGMIPFILCSNPLSISDSFFEAMSGFTTTGASALPSVENYSHGIIMWRSLMQWIGGMGIILFTLAVIPMLNHAGGIQMFNAEVTGITHDKIRPRISQTAKGLWAVYIILTLVLIFLLWLGPMDFYESMCHAFSAISTGGYSTVDDSIAHYNSNYTKIILIVFMFLGGVNFGLMYRAGIGEWKPIFQNDVFRTYVRMVLAFWFMFIISIVLRGQYTDILSVTIDPLFIVISTITSTGLAVVDYEQWGPFIWALMLMMMFFGACAGSTSGGAKLDRMLCLLKNTRNEIHRALHPNAVMSVRINGRVVPQSLVSKVLAFLCLFIIILTVGTTLLTAFHIPLSDALFSSFSCLCNTGFGSGVTGPSHGFGNVPDITKWIMSAMMLIGRLEIFTILILFTRSFWNR